MRINFNLERYCHKCHKILDKKAFKASPQFFKVSACCKACYYKDKSKE